MELGTNIRTRRTELGLTLEALAEKSHVSRAMLSDIEREAKSPTIRVISQIAAGLDCTISELLGEPEPKQQPALQLVRKSQRQILVEPRSGVERHLLSPSLVRHGIEISWIVVPPGQSSGVIPPQAPGTVEHITVVRGSLRCRLGANEVVLAEGDLLTFPGDVEQVFSNHDKKPSRGLLVIDGSHKRP